MKDILIEIDRIAEEELERANKIHPIFASDHEGIAVIQEEIEEAIDDMEFVGKNFKAAWTNIKNDDEENAQFKIEEVKGFARSAAAELIQVMAMCDKFVKSQEARNEYRN